MTDSTTDKSASQTYQSSFQSKGVVGKLIGNRYEVQKYIGRGGFGVTYLAKNIELPGQPLCLVKHLVPKFFTNYKNNNAHLLTAAQWKFYLEARTLGLLASHCQVPTLLDYFTIANNTFLVLEYIHGYTLADLVKKYRPFNEREVENFLTQMLKLLNYIHSFQLIHRDIKPENIILSSSDNRLVLIDFGAVKDRSIAHQLERKLEQSQAIGTPGFAPPEQIADQTVYASDIYALGMTCLYLLTGKEPLSFPTNSYTCEIQWEDQVQISQDLKDVINKMIKISLAQRYNSVTQILNALDNRNLRAKLQKYTLNKYSMNSSFHTGQLTNNSNSPYYPPAVKWALDMKHFSNVS